MSEGHYGGEGEPCGGGEGGVTGGLRTLGKVTFQGAYRSNFPQEGPTSRAHASEGHSREYCRARMKSFLNSSVIWRHTSASARWSRMHASPTARATRSSFSSVCVGQTDQYNEGTVYAHVIHSLDSSLPATRL